METTDGAPIRNDEEADELATDEHGCTQIRERQLQLFHLCSSVANSSSSVAIGVSIVVPTPANLAAATPAVTAVSQNRLPAPQTPQSLPK
jgi:hypothetical protein